MLYTSAISAWGKSEEGEREKERERVGSCVAHFSSSLFLTLHQTAHAAATIAEE